MGVCSGDEPLTKQEREELRASLLKDRGPAYIPWLVEEYGAQAGLFMSQLLFWDGKGHDPDGWIYKSENEWRRETGLTRSAVRNARKILTRKGVLEEDKRGLPRRLYYRADLRALMAVLDGKQLLPAAEDPEDLEDLWDEDPWDSDEAPEESGREEDEQPPVSNLNISEEGITSPTSKEHVSHLTSKEDITSLSSEEVITLPASEANTTDPAYTESTSENTTENLQRVEAGEFTLQGDANQGFAPHPQKERRKNEEYDAHQGGELQHSATPTPISEISTKKKREKNSKRATAFEINRIMQMLTDERFPTCGVYRRFEEGRLSNQQLLEAVSYELTGSFEETERYRVTVEHCAKILKQEEGIA